MFSKKEIATYYNHTLLHYKVAWQLKKSKGLHYGLWYDDTKNLHEAIQNTNRKVAGFLNQDRPARILDAGCGVGGSAIYLAKNYSCQVDGITLSPVQHEQGQKYVESEGLQDKVSLSVQDFTQTSFPDQSFDLVFGIESYCHAIEKSDVYQEAMRLLKPGGSFVMIDSLKTPKGEQPEHQKTIHWLLDRWAISDLDGIEETQHKLEAAGFEQVKIENLSANAWKSIRRIYRKSHWGVLTIPLYALVYPTKYHFSRRHPESGWALYRCFKRDLLHYVCVSGRKPD